MAWLARFFRSSIGCKVVMAASGIVLVLFLLGHLSGNLLVFAGPAAINTYAKLLHSYTPMLWVVRTVLLAMLAAHVGAGLRLAYLNKLAKPQGYKRPQAVAASLPSRYMALTGLVVLSFFFFHLAHLTLRWTHPEFSQLATYDVYSMLLLSFASPTLSFFYCLCIFLLMAHLNHGIASLFQTLGISHPKYDPLIHTLGPALSVVLACGYISIPLSILFGIIS